MATTLLYHRDPLLLSFDAVVASVDGEHVVLDETAFYPEAGGQMADRGELAGVAVVDVQVDDDGVVRHKLAAAANVAPGMRVRGVVDRARRRQFMALHTAQHMLSRALIEAASAETVSARLGESVCTIDVDVPAVADAALAKAEALVNAVVDDDVPVLAWFPSESELRALPLRRQPKVASNVRVVTVGELAHAFDVSPCGGTHCTSTAQIGLVRVIGVERYKGMTRVLFQAGPRARAEVFERARVLEALAKDMSASPGDVPTQIEKLRAQIKLARDDRAVLVDRLADVVAVDLCARAVDVLGAPAAVALVDGDVDLLRAVASRVVARGVDALLGCRTADGLQVLLMRAATSTRDCGALLKKLAAAHGGRGGGKPERAEGRLPAAVDWATIAV